MKHLQNARERRGIIMNKSLETRKVITDFVEFANNLVNLDSNAEYYYWMTEAILKAADTIRDIERH